jgi:hypothetical protein
MADILKSPEGTAIRPRLNTPDTKHSRSGMYHTRIRFTASDAAPLIATIDEALKDALWKARLTAKTERIAKRIKQAEPPYMLTDDGSGDVEIRFRRKALVLNRHGRPTKHCPYIFNASGDNDQKLVIAHGDTIRVSYFIVPYVTGAIGAGVTLDMRCVQVTKQCDAWEQSAADYGFNDDSEPAALTASSI